MNDKQKYYGENARWIVKEVYFGKFHDERALCSCLSLGDAKQIINGLLVLNNGRPFEYKAVKIVEDYKPIYDAITDVDIFTGEIINDEKYINGISCLSEQ